MRPKKTRTQNENNIFLNLPTELRTMIFTQILMLTPYISTHWMDASIWLYLTGVVQNDSGPYKGLPQWLLTSKVFFFESRVILNSIFDFTIGLYRPSTEHQKDPNFQMIRPSWKETLTIRTGKLRTSDYLRGACFKLSASGTNTIEYIMRHVIEEDERGRCQSRLRTLRVQAAFTNVCTVCQWHEHKRSASEAWDLDLGYLEDFELDLDVFEFGVGDTDTKNAQDGYSHHSNCWAQVEQAFWAEVRRVGRELTRDSQGFSSMGRTESTRQTTVIFHFQRRTAKGRRSLARVEGKNISGPLRKPTKSLE